MAMLGAALILTLARLVPPVSVATESKRQATISRRRSGFRILTVIGGFDTATRMGYPLFLPFLVQHRKSVVQGKRETVRVAPGDRRVNNKQKPTTLTSSHDEYAHQVEKDHNYLYLSSH